jgi:phosphoribosylaminoimidazole-succinocarboxamide synthase
LPNFYRGKVRDNYDLPDGRRIHCPDRVSAFDQNLAVIPFKGQMLTQIARFGSTPRATPPQPRDQYPDPNVLVRAAHDAGRDRGARLSPRHHLDRSRRYKKGERTLYGIVFPDGPRDNQKLPQTVLTPTTAAAHGAHDEPLSGEDASRAPCRRRRR